ncbi:MAG TPA: AfsR/SARP family transcriptional regulator [Pseudonocardiaceae bacterium]
MELRLLGTVEVWAGETRLRVGARRERLVLGVLALEVNRPVPTERLVALMWPDGAPVTARQGVAVGVCRLRRVLTGEGGRPRVETVGRGYRLAADPASVDAHRFRELVAMARTRRDDRGRVRVYREALALWRGPALADAADPATARRLTQGLAEARLTAVEECLDAELRLGRHAVVLDELTDLVARHPFRQRLTARLMLAQYRAGRPSDALATYREAWERLRDGVGIEPEPRLRLLHAAILRADPALEAPHRPVAPPPRRRHRTVLLRRPPR